MVSILNKKGNVTVTVILVVVIAASIILVAGSPLTKEYKKTGFGPEGVVVATPPASVDKALSIKKVDIVTITPIPPELCPPSCEQVESCEVCCRLQTCFSPPDIIPPVYLCS